MKGIKRTLLTIINIIACLAFFVAACGIESHHYLACALVMGISLGWIYIFAYANGR